MTNKTITNKMLSAVSQQIFPGAVLLCAKDRTIVYHSAFGVADIDEQRPMVKNSIFDLASLTKPLATGLAIAKLIDQQKVTLETTVGEILDGFTGSDKAGLTMDMLLRHTAGLPPYKEYYAELIKHDLAQRASMLTRMILDEPFIYKPGTDQAYSDIGFMILGRCIETITGQPINEYVKTQFYDPLDCDLFYIPLLQKEWYMEQFGDLIVSTQDCPWRKKRMKGETDDDNTWAVGGIDGHAGLFGDAISIYKICKELLNALTGKGSTLIDPAVLKQMVVHKNGHDMVAGFDSPSKQRSSAGRYFSAHSIGHLGFTGTSFWIDPDTELIVILLTNRVHPSRSNEKIKAFRPELHNLICETLL